MRIYHYLEAKWALDDIRRHRLKVSKIDDMNDPYEWRCVRSDVEESQLALERTERRIVELHSALCFSKSWNNILMWSHYADKHRGICLGFDVANDKTSCVEYLEELIPVGGLRFVRNEGQERLIQRLYAAKYEGWRYEEEVRMNGSRKEKDEETGQYFVSFGEDLKLKEVIAGARFPMSQGPIEEALKGYADDVKITKARGSAHGFEIVLDERGFDR